MAHETPLSNIVFQRPDGTTGELSVHDTESLHNDVASVKESNIANGAVVAEKIADGAITSSKIEDGAITSDKVSTDFWSSSVQMIKSSLIKFTIGGNGSLAAEIPINVPEGYEAVAIKNITNSHANIMTISGFTLDNEKVLVLLKSLSSSSTTFELTATVSCIRY